MVRITKNWLTTKFHKQRGTDADIKLWHEFSSEDQSSLLFGTELLQDEVPVIATMQGPTWIVFTTARVLWGKERPMHSLNFNQITHVTAPKEEHQSKLDMSELLVTDRFGATHTIRTQPGTPLFIFWNMLLDVAPRKRE